MKFQIFCLAVVFTISTAASAFAGGRACRFDADGLRLMKDQALLGELLKTKLSIVDNGLMGPDNSPWDKVIGRMYSFMEFKASAIDDSEKKYLIRVHFNRVEKSIFFKSLEVLPILEPVKVATPVAK